MAKAIPHNADQDESYSLDEAMTDEDGDQFYTADRDDVNLSAGPEDKNLADLDAKRAALGIS